MEKGTLRERLYEDIVTQDKKIVGRLRVGKMHQKQSDMGRRHGETGGWELSKPKHVGKYHKES